MRACIARAAVAGLGTTVLLALGAGSAAASCAADPRSLDEQLAEAPVAFVGTVADVRHETTASFRVDEVWKGDVPAQVTVFGGPDEPGTATSVDRYWQAGATYLVVPQVTDGELHDNSCSPTREWSEDLAAGRPATAHAPQPAPEPEGRSDGVLIGVAGLVLVLGLGVTVVVLRPGRTET